MFARKSTYLSSSSFYWEAGEAVIGHRAEQVLPYLQHINKKAIKQTSASKFLCVLPSFIQDCTWRRAAVPAPKLFILIQAGD